MEARCPFGADIEMLVTPLCYYMHTKQKDITDRFQKWYKKIEMLVFDAPFRRQFDKYGMVYGLNFLIVFAFLLGKYPRTHFITFISILIPVHLVVRVICNYFKKKMFILIDFCYFGNLAFFLFLYFAPKNETLFRLVYMQTNGPMAVAIGLFRSTFAIHKPDMLTSVFTHVIPYVTTNLIRWQLMPEEAHLPEEERYFCTISEDISWGQYGYWMMGVPLFVYWAWLSAYLIVIFYFCSDYIRRND